MSAARDQATTEKRRMNSTWRCMLFLGTCLLIGLPAFCGHTLTPQERKVLEGWLGQHPEFRVATDEDCDCADDIKEMKAGDGGEWKPVPDYHPYVATGDFNGDGVQDFAVVLIDLSKQEKNFVLVVFNGPFKSAKGTPAFVKAGLDLKYYGLFYGPPRPKPYRLLVGRFETDSGWLVVPHGRGYKLSD
jgi:hypothetical protein